MKCKLARSITAPKVQEIELLIQEGNALLPKAKLDSEDKEWWLKTTTLLIQGLKEHIALQSESDESLCQRFPELNRKIAQIKVQDLNLSQKENLISDCLLEARHPWMPQLQSLICTLEKIEVEAFNASPSILKGRQRLLGIGCKIASMLVRVEY